MKPKTLKRLRIVTGTLFLISGFLTIVSLFWDPKITSLITGILYIAAGILWLLSAFRTVPHPDEGDQEYENISH